MKNENPLNGKDKYDLQRIARDDSNPEVRKAAVNKLSEDGSKYDLQSIAKHDSDDKVRKIAQLKLEGKQIPADILKSLVELKQEKTQKIKEGLKEAENRGKDVCWGCLTVKPNRCMYCNACVNCRGGYASIFYNVCYLHDYDDD